MICYIAGNFEAGNSLNLAIMAAIGQHSQVTLHCLLLSPDVINCTVLSSQIFWRETVSLLYVI